MGFIPAGAKWYLAEIVEEITVEGDPRHVVHTNMTLVRADSPEEAYQNALALGAAGAISYENPRGRQVTIRFRGLRDLNVIHDDLEHGAELIYSEDIGWDEPAIRKWVSPKKKLGVFAPMAPRKEPDYSSKEIVEEVISLIANARPKPRKNNKGRRPRLPSQTLI